MKPKQENILVVALLLIIAIFMVLLLTSCTPQQRTISWVSAAESYNVTVNTLTELRKAKKIDDNTARKIEIYRQLARLSLDAWKDALLKNRPPDAAIAEFTDNLSQLKLQKKLIEGE